MTAADNGSPTCIYEFRHHARYVSDAPLPPQAVTEATAPRPTGEIVELCAPEENDASWQDEPATEIAGQDSAGQVTGDEPVEEDISQGSDSADMAAGNEGMQGAVQEGVPGFDARSTTGGTAGDNIGLGREATRSGLSVEQRDTTYRDSTLGDIREGVGGAFNHVGSGLREGYQNWRASTHDSEQILAYGAFGVTALLTLAAAPKLFSALGLDGGGFLGATGRLVATGAIVATLAGIAGDMARGKGFVDATADSVVDTFEMFTNGATAIGRTVSDLTSRGQERDPSNALDVGGQNGNIVEASAGKEEMDVRQPQTLSAPAP